MRKTGIVVHGGAGIIRKTMMTAEKEKKYSEGLEEALTEGMKILFENGSAIDATTKAVQIMEDNPIFNAGKGSVYTSEGRHEMDASIMDGNTLKAGCVSCVTNIKNPIILAKELMQKSHHVNLSGKGAEEFAKINSIDIMNDDYFHSEFRFTQLLKAKEQDKIKLDHSDEKKHGTVGAVAIDKEGNLAAATSSGGMTNKKPGRIGDSAIIGAGTYANNNTCAVSCTGEGEYFIRNVTAFDISAMMDYQLLTLEQACNEVIKKLSDLGGNGGLIAIDKKGNYCMVMNSEGMYRGYMFEGEKPVIKIFNESEL
jgi:L-asparaginase / beta-aspartyl-peptidase